MVWQLRNGPVSGPNNNLLRTNSFSERGLLKEIALFIRFLDMFIPVGLISCPTNGTVSNPMTNILAMRLTLFSRQRWNTVCTLRINALSLSPNTSISSIYTSQMLYMRPF